MKYRDPAEPGSVTSKWMSDNLFDPALRALRVSLDSPYAVDSIYESGEVVDISPGAYKGMIVGGHDSDTNVFTPLTFTDGRLRVDADITLQSVELDMDTSALDGDSMGIWGYPDGDENATPIPFNVNDRGHLRIIMGYAGIETNNYQEVIVSGQSQQTILSEIIPADTEFQVLQVSCSGAGEGVFKIKKNNQTLVCKRTSWANRNVEFSFLYGYKLDAGDIIEVEVENTTDEAHEYNASFYGEFD